MTGFAYFVVNGLRRSSCLFEKVSELVVGCRSVDWLVIAAALLLFLALLSMFHVFWGWVFFGVIAVVAAVSLHWKVDQDVQAERAMPIESARAIIKAIRLQGIDEEAIRQFVCRASGRQWEEFYESLFGFDAKLNARIRWGAGEDGFRRPRHASWREPVSAWLDLWIRRKQAERDLKLLQRTEEKSLEAQGVNLLTARRKAKRIAEAMVAVVTERSSGSRHFASANEGEPIPIARALREAALRPEDVLVEHEPVSERWRFLEWFSTIVGQRVRFLTGALLMAGFLAWVHQNEIVTSEHLQKLKEAAKKAAEDQDLKALRDANIDINLDRPTKALRVNVPDVPTQATRLLGLFNGFNPGVAGLILLISSLFSGWRVGIGAFLGSAVAWLGPSIGIPSIGPVSTSSVAMLLGGSIGTLSILLLRRR